MSIIQDALKKAQEDRKKRNSREVPYHLSGVQTKSKTATTIYVVAGLCVGAIFVYLYVPYFHKSKQITQPVVAQTSAPARPVQVNVNMPPASEPRKTAVEIQVGKVVSIEKPVPSVAPNNKEETAGVKVGITRTRKPAVSSPVERKTKAVEPDIRDNTANEPLRMAERKTGDASADSMYNEASREQQSGRTREARTIYKQILAKQPDHVETLNNLGVIAIYEGSTQEALLYFRRILEYRKGYSKAYNNIGLIAMKDGDRQLAEEYLRKAITLEPDDPGPYVNLSALLRSQGKLQEAAKLLEIPIQKKAKDPNIFLSYAVVKDNLGQYEDAARYYRQYLSSIQTPTSRKDIVERLQYIEGKR
jgi:Flp pilus assembly protein TadD